MASRPIGPSVVCLKGFVHAGREAPRKEVEGRKESTGGPRRILKQIQDGARRNEMRSSTKSAVDYIADRLDRGMKIDVVVSNAVDGANTQVREQISELQRTVAELRSQISQSAISAEIIPFCLLPRTKPFLTSNSG